MNELTRAAGEFIEGSYTDINTLTIEIKAIWSSALESELSYAVKLGRKLTEAKKLLEHGEWGPWIKENLPFSQDKANMMMKIYENYGASQESLFGEINSETFRNLGISQAFALLSVPENEREEFVVENDAENLSVRELKKRIEEMNSERDALKKKADALDSDNRMLRQSNAEFNKKLQEAEKAASETQKAKAEKDAAEERAKVAARNEKDAKEKLAAAVKAEQEARAALAEAKANPEIPPEKIRELERAAEEKARKAAEESSSAEVQEMQGRIGELEKQLQMASPDVVIFKEYFQQLQETMNRVIGCIAKVKNSDPQTAEKLKAATVAITDNFRGRL